MPPKRGVLLDREAELAASATALRAANDGEGSLLMFTGQLGIGKSTLLRQLSALPEARDARFIRAAGAPMERDFELGIICQLFAPVVTGVPGDEESRWLADADHVVREMLPEGADPMDPELWAGMRPTIPAKLHELLARLSREQTVVIVVDDLQWADTPSLRLLVHLAKLVADLRMVIVVTVWEEWPHPGEWLLRQLAALAGTRMELHGLSLAGTAAFVNRRFGRRGDPKFVHACQEVSAGNPLSLATVLDGLIAKEAPPTASQAATVRALTPALLLDQRMFCLNAQPGPVRELAGAMAVLAGTEPELVATLAGLGDAAHAEALRRLGRLGLLATGAAGKLVDTAVERAVEETMTAEAREQLHLAAARLLHRSGRPAERVAAQLLSITSAQDDWTTSMFRAAARATLLGGAPETAARYLRCALLGSSSDGEDRARLLLELAGAERGFDPVSSVRHVSQAILLLPSVSDRAAAAMGIPPGMIGSNPMLPPVVRKTAEKLGKADELTGEDREAALRLEARLRHFGGADATRLGDAVARLRGFTPGPPMATGGERELSAALVWAATVTGRLTSGEAAYLANRILAGETASPDHVHTAVASLVPALIAADSAAGLGAWLDGALDRARQRNSLVAQTLIHAEQSLLYLHNGQLAQAKILALRAYEDTESSWYEAIKASTSVLAAIALETRDVELADRILAARPVSDDLNLTVHLRMLRGFTASARGDLPAALDSFLDCGTRLLTAGWVNPSLYSWRVWAAHLHGELGDTGKALELADQEFELASDWGAPAARGRALRARGALTEGPDGVLLLREAVDALRESGDRLELSKALVHLSRRLRTAGEADAGTWLREGSALAEAGGFSWAPAGAAGEFHGPVPRLIPSGLAALTKTEQTVVEFVVNGRSNQDIAAVMNVTRRTVEKHLTSAYRKLGVSGRGGLATLKRLPSDTVGEFPNPPRVGKITDTGK
jgi:DNA-binding CsgD family transcriptional regulator/tetratricopeptide (TPR) repeat protein